MPKTDNCCLVAIDVQGKLATLMHDREQLVKNIQILIKSAKILSIPILWCQQVPDALGETVTEIAELLGDIEPVNKASFSCCRDDGFNKKLTELDRKEAILCGIETHVCVYQTARDLKQEGFKVGVICDAVSSRTQGNKEMALAKMQAMGIDISSTEMVLFELLKTAEHPKFKHVAKLIK